MMITSDNIKIAYEEHGFGIPVLLIHGWAATRNFWRGVKELEGFRTILPDLRGHGESDRAKSYTKERIILDLYELAVGLGLKELCIVGHSLGGIIATKFAVSFPEFTIRKLILVATPPIFKIGKFKRMLTTLMLYLFNPILRRRFTPKTLYRRDKELLEFIWSESAKGSRRAYVKFLSAFDGESIIDDLEEIKAEKIAIIPSHDNIIPTDLQKQTYSELCDKTIIIEECGHNLMLEKPEEFHRILLDVLK